MKQFLFNFLLVFIVVFIVAYMMNGYPAALRPAFVIAAAASLTKLGMDKFFTKKESS